ncbi:MAG: lipid-A-disaccharide synthase N-terminal domain-containing protein [bacterium]
MPRKEKKRVTFPIFSGSSAFPPGFLLLTYAIHRKDPVFILGQSVGSFIYLRNIILIYRKKPVQT